MRRSHEPVTMQRRHFEVIAEVMKDAYPVDPAAVPAWIATVEAFGARLSQTNPGFKITRFKRACGLGEEEDL